MLLLLFFFFGLAFAVEAGFFGFLFFAEALCLCCCCFLFCFRFGFFFCFASGLGLSLEFFTFGLLCSVATALLTSLREIRQITDRNASGVKQTRGGTDDLLRRAQALVTMVARPAERRSNGRPSRSTR